MSFLMSSTSVPSFDLKSSFTSLACWKLGVGVPVSGGLVFSGGRDLLYGALIMRDAPFLWL